MLSYDNFYIIIILIFLIFICFVIFILKHFVKQTNKFMSYVDKIFEINFNSIHVKQNDFELNTKKFVEKKINLLEKSIDTQKFHINNFIEYQKENTQYTNSLREKNKLNYEKIKSLEKNYKDIGTTISELKIIDKTNCNNIDNSDKQKVINFEQINNLEKTILTLQLKINMIENKTNLIIEENTVLKKNNNYYKKEYNNITNKINLITEQHKENKKLITELIIKNILDDIISKINFENKVLLNNNECIDQIISKNFHLSEQLRFINDISKLISEEHILFEQYFVIKKCLEQKNINSNYILPDGFNVYYIENGNIFTKENTLHLLSCNYRTTIKFIEIVFCKFFIDKINIDKYSQFYINQARPKTLMIHRHDIKSETPIIPENSIEFTFLENHCLRGIFYVFIKRKLSLQRFIDTYNKILETK